MVDVPLCPLPQVIYLRVFDCLWKITHVICKGLVHQLQAADQKFQIIVERDMEPLICTLGGIGDEVREGFVEGSDGVIDIIMED